MRGLTVVSPDNSDASAGTASTAGQSSSAGIFAELNNVVQNIQQAIQRTVSWDNTDSNKGYGPHGGKGDHWVTGDTNWDGYELPALVQMVAVPASPTQVDTVAAAWRANGAAITQSAENLSQSLNGLLTFWQGTAAQQAVTSITGSANWISSVGDTAAKMADSVEDSGGALQSAQNTMPGQPTNVFWSSFNTAADGSTAGSAAGPVGSAAGAMTGGLTSVFGAGSDQAAQKQQAVQTMQRYEQAAMSIDSATPAFTSPPTWGVLSASGGGTSIGTATLPGGAGLAGLNGNNQSTMPSFADSPIGRWNALTGNGIGGSGGAGGLSGLGGHGGADSGAFAGLFGGGGFGGGGGESDHETEPGPQSGAAAVASAAHEEPAGVLGRAGGASGDLAGGVMEDVDAAPGGGMPMMGGGMMGGMRGGGGQGDDGEHRRRIPFEEDPFLTGLKAAPRVIGLNSLDREDGEK